MKLSKFFALAAAALLPLGAFAADHLHFLVVGDTGTGAEGQMRVAAAMANYAGQNQKTNPLNFVLMVGDNFYNDGVTTVTNKQWQEKFEKAYDPKRLGVPFYVVLGNHDWRSDLPDVEIDYARAHPESRWQMDGHYYKRSFPGETTNVPLADFFLIDTEAWNQTSPHVEKYPDKKLAQKQMAWLETELAASRARWKFVVAHHPLYTDGAHFKDSQILALRKQLRRLFKKWNVDAFITGHDHMLERIEVPGEPTLFLISGAGSKLYPVMSHEWKPFVLSELGFAAIDLTATEMRGQFLDHTGKIRDTWHRAPLSAAK